MKVFNTTYIATAMILTMLLGFTCQAEEPPLQLNGKSLTVYPIVLARPDTAIDEETQKFGERIAEVVGLTLEQHGMLPGVSANYPETIVPDDALGEVEKKFQTFVEGEAIETDYALFAFFGVKPSGRGPAVVRICAALTDVSGRIAWSKLLARVFEIDVTRCEACGGRLQVVETVTNQRRIRELLGGARGPPAVAREVEGQMRLF